MGYGLEVYRQNGSVAVSTNDRLTRYIDYFTVARDSAGSKSYPGLEGQELQAMTHNLDGYWFTHRVNVVGYTVYWGRGTVPDDWEVGPTGITVMGVG